MVSLRYGANPLYVTRNGGRTWYTGMQLGNIATVRATLPGGGDAMPELVLRSDSYYSAALFRYYESSDGITWTMHTSGRPHACTIGQFSIAGKRGGGGAGTVNTRVSLFNRGPTCRLVPIGARAYDTKSERFVGAPGYPSKPTITGSLSPYATRKLLGDAAHGTWVHVVLGYTDVAVGEPGCGKATKANSMAFWITGHPASIAVVRIPVGGSLTFGTCSARTYLWPYWPSTGAFLSGA